MEEIAELAEQQNLTSENIGARRLSTILEKVLEDINYEASGDEEKEVVIDKKFVENAMSKLIKSTDLTKYIL